MAPLSEAQRSLLRDHILTLPLIDAHAHNLVDHRTSSFPFLRSFSEAEDDALLFAPHTLSFKRCLRDVADLYSCNASLEEIESYRQALDIEALCAKCLEFSNLSGVLIDDGLKLNKMHDLEWHKHIFCKVYRILRIERLAEEILNEGLAAGLRWTLDSFSERFVASLKELAKTVVGFKSIAAYRGGLNVNPLVSKQHAEEGLEICLKSGTEVRIQDKSFGDFIFLCGLEVATLCGIPMQIHTGFGDKDLDLRFANPLHLRPVLEDKRFLNSQIVLLHASYPFFKEASYLASVYTQVYLDIGLAVPKLSVKGMCSAVSGLLDLCPLSKVMFSTDGYAFPETFFLGIKWAREIFLYVLSESCADGDLSFDEALQAASDIFYNNSTKLYKLNQILQNGPYKDKVISNLSLNGDDKQQIKFVRLLWSDGSGQRRCRVIPKDKFEVVTKIHGVGLTECCMAMSSHTDGPAEGSDLTAVGEIRLLPDISTLHVLPWSMQEEMVLVDMHLTAGSPWEYCPRSTLKRLSSILQEEFGLVMKAGFESEFYILKQNSIDNRWIGFDSTPYCSSTSFDGASSMLLEISNALSSLGVNIDQLHAEAGGGQFEIALQFGPSMKAADDLLIVRETIKCLIQRHGLLATFLPKYFPSDIGSGSHVHLSLWQEERNVFMGDSGSRFGISGIGENFMAGVLHHLPSLLAFISPLPNSYERLKPNTWSGAFHCWGRENREAPLRASCPPGTQADLVNNFELKSFDGCANPHLGLAAIMAAGIDGLRKRMDLPDPINANPSTLAPGVLRRLPSSLDQAVVELENNEILKEILGFPLVKTIIAIRHAEVQFYKDTFNGESLISRY